MFVCVCVFSESVVMDYLDTLRASSSLCASAAQTSVHKCKRVCVLPIIHEESSSSSISSSSQDVRVTSKERQRPLTPWPQFSSFASGQGENPLATATSSTTTTETEDLKSMKCRDSIHLRIKQTTLNCRFCKCNRRIEGNQVKKIKPTKYIRFFPFKTLIKSKYSSFFQCWKENQEPLLEYNQNTI